MVSILERAPTTTALALSGVRYRYGAVEVLRGVDLAVEPGEVVAVRGRSGSGKSTLLHLAGGLAAPAGGRVAVAGIALAGRSARQLAIVRRRHVGFVFQAFHLLAGLRLVENVALPLVLDGAPARAAHARAARALADVGLDGLADRKPAEVSGGQLQRAAVARALVTAPALLLADEPTGNLDDESAGDVLTALLDVARRRRTACVVVTHDAAVAAAADRTFALEGGVLR